VKINGECPLYYQVIFNSNLLRLPVGVSLKPKEWDIRKGQPKGNVLLTKKLERKEQKIKDFIDDSDLHGIAVTKCTLKEFYNGKDDKKDFYYHFDNYTKKKFYTISDGTQNHYLLLKKQLKEYKTSFQLKELNYNFFDDFFFYLRHEKKVGESGLAMRRKNFITVLEEFVKLGLIGKNYCIDIPKFKENVKTVFLSKSEIVKLNEADLEIEKKAYGLNLTRDLFLFSCYTGLRYSDVMNLTTKMIKDRRIIMEIQKTKREIMIPICNEALVILKKYNYEKKSGIIFPQRSNVSVNRDLKEIAEISEINKWITFHVGRHTFGSTLAVEGIQPFYIMKLMGHADVRMTTRYVNADNDILEDAMKTVNFLST
jgi:integrase